MPDPTPGDLFPTLDRLAPLSPAEMLAQLLGKQRQHWELGERVPVETLLERLKAAGASWLDEDGILDLIYNEIVLREERGDKPAVEEYLGRFPQYAEQLRWQFSVHEGLRDCSFWKMAPGAEAPPGPLGVLPPAPPGNGPATEVNQGGGPAVAGTPWDLPTLQGGPSAALPHDKTVRPPEGKTVVPGGEQPPTAPGQGARAAGTGEVIPNYEVLGELGRGGMGVVYKARHTKLRRLVALKMILAGVHAGAEERQRFLREAESVARLQHPNIIQIYEVGEHKGLPYLSLEFCAGGSLASRLDGTPLPPREAAQLIETLARAMHAAHQQQIIHRDLKPANILLTADGRPKITDFGLAKKLDERGQTRTGEVMGTPSYMAPEQASGQAADVGPATDIYALGALLYELITGRAPFRAATPLDTLRQVVSDEPVPPSRLQPRIPRDLETVCLKCLQKEPRKRYATALDLADDLARFRTGESIWARPVSVWERGLKWARQRPAIAALLALVLLTAVAGFTGVTWQWRQAEEARRRKAAALEEAETLLYFNRIALADREWLTNHMARVDDLLGQCPRRLRNWEWKYLHHLCHADVLTLPGSAAVAFSPDGGRLASAEGNDVHLRDAAGGRDLLVLRGHTSRVKGVAYSGDGGRVAASGDDGSVIVWETQAGQELFTWPLGDGLGPVAFSPDGQLLAAAAESHIRLLDAATGRPVHKLEGHSSPVTGLAFAPDGKLLASSSRDQTVRLWEVEKGREAGMLRGHADKVTGVAFSPDGLRLVSSGEDESLRFWHVVQRREEKALLGQGGKVTAVAFSPDGGLIASAGGDALQPGEVKVWDALTGQLQRTFRGHNGAVTSLAFQPHGDHLASADREAVRVWDVTLDQASQTLGAQHGALNAVAASPDGRLLASAGADGAVRVWEVGGKRDPVVLRGHEGQVPGVAFLGTTGLLASCGFDGTVRVWDLAGHKELRPPLRGHTDLVWSVASDPVGDRLASASQDGTVKVWDPATGTALLTLEGHEGQVNCVGFSPDGRRLASSGADRTVRLWDPATGAAVRTLTGHTTDVTCLAFSPDGRRLASGGGNVDREEIKIWDVGTGGELLAPGGRTGKIMGLAFSPDGKRLASASEDGTVKLLETARGQEVLTLRGHRGAVYCVGFSPDGRWIASAGKDGTLRLWEAPPPEN